MVDVAVDITAEMVLPDRDANNKRGLFFTKTSRLLVGLEPAEVGYVTLPASCSPHTAPASNYLLEVKLQVKCLSKNANRVREPHGGGLVATALMSEHAQQEIQKLQQLTFSADSGNKRNHLQDTFAVLPKSGLTSLRELKPGWVSLWTMRDHLDDRIMLQRVRPEIEQVLPQLNREVLFKPLLQTTQQYFQKSSYALHVVEAVYITKLLCLLLEQGGQLSLDKEPPDGWPRWFVQMARLLFQEKRLVQQVPHLVTEHLYFSVIEAALQHGFAMLKTVLGESFGSADELEDYCSTLIQCLLNEEPVDFAKTYLPLVAAGVIANTRVTMPREQTRETLSMLSKALQQRAVERTDGNAHIFQMVDKLIDRGLEKHE
jgi:hypothetical protein